jgi:hypothetical protein
MIDYSKQAAWVIEPLADLNLAALSSMSKGLVESGTIEGRAVAELLNRWLTTTQLPTFRPATSRYSAGTAQDDWDDQHGHKGCGGSCGCGDKCGKE